MFAELGTQSLRRTKRRGENRGVLREPMQQLERRVLLSASVLHVFTAAEGNPGFSTFVEDSNGILYGTTSTGGTNGLGTVFKFNTLTNQFNTIASFSSATGGNPEAGMVMDGAGNLYGTTTTGGGGFSGTIFEVANGTSTITPLLSLTSQWTSSLTADSAGNLYGTLFNNGGAVFEVAHGSNAITTLASFPSIGGNRFPRGGVVRDAAGNLYGAVAGGVSGYGSVYELAVGSSTITTLASFLDKTVQGEDPEAKIFLDANGDLFGTAEVGGGGSPGTPGAFLGDGTVFELAKGSSTITVVGTFNGTNGRGLSSSVVVDASGNVFGMTTGGGANGQGNVYGIAAGTQTIATLASFDGTTNGSSPQGNLFLDGNGNLFGTTTGSPGGAIFELPATVSAYHLVFTQQPPNIAAGAAMPGTITVAMEDASNNIVTSFNGDVVLGKEGVEFASSGGITVPVQAVNGVATFTPAARFTFDQAGTFQLQAWDDADGLTALSNPFTVSPLAASRLSFTQTPSNSPSAGTVLSPLAVSITDKFGNIITNRTANITLSVGSGPSAIQGTKTVRTANGTATFSDIVLNTAGTYVLNASDPTDGFTGTDGPFLVSPGVATHLVFTQQPSNVAAGAVMVPAVTVAVEDAFGNIVTNSANSTFTSSVSLSLSGSPGVFAFAQTFSGVATFSNLTFNAGGNYTLVALGTVVGATTVLQGSTSQPFTVAVGPATQLLWNQQPTAIVAGQHFSPAISVALKDASGHTVTTGARNMTISVLSGPGTPTGTLTVQTVNGVATFSDVTFNTAGSYTIRVSDPADALSTTTATFTVSPGTPAQIAFAHPPAITVAQRGSLALAVEDQFGNVIPAISDNLVLSSWSGPGVFFGTTTASAAGGIATFNDVTFTAVGNYTLSVFDGARSFSSSLSLTVNPGPATSLTWRQQPANIAAGQPLSLSLLLTDHLNNSATTDTSNPTISIASGPGPLSGTTTSHATNGTVSFSNASLTTPGTYTLLVSDPQDGITSAVSASFTVTPAAAAQLVFLQQPANLIAGTAAPTIALAIEDAFGNILTSDNASFSLTFPSTSGFPISDPIIAKAVNGILTISYGSNRAGTYSIKASDSADNLSAASNPFTIAPAAAALLQLSNLPQSAIAGAPLSVTATLEDAFGNLVSASTSLTLSVSGPGPLSGATTARLSSGTATFSNLSLSTPGNYSLTITDAADNLSATTSTFTLGAGSASRIIFFTPPPVEIVANEPFPFSLFVSDSFDNSADQIVTLSLPFAPSGATLRGQTSVQTVNGIATFSNISVSKTGNYYLQANAGNLSVVSQQLLADPPPARLALAKALPATAIAGKSLPLSIQTLDTNNYIVTADTSTVSVAISAHGKLLGNTTASVFRGVATFSNLSITSPGNYTLTLRDASLKPITTSTITITADAASAHLRLIQSPKPTRLGKPLSPAIVVDVEDKFGNHITTNHSTVALRILTGPKGAAILNPTAPITNGVATFNATQLTRGGNYTLSLTDTALPIKTPITLSETILPLPTALTTPAVNTTR